MISMSTHWWTRFLFEEKKEASRQRRADEVNMAKAEKDSEEIDHVCASITSLVADLKHTNKKANHG